MATQLASTDLAYATTGDPPENNREISQPSFRYRDAAEAVRAAARWASTLRFEPAL